MNRHVLVLLFVILPTVHFAQVVPDSIQGAVAFSVDLGSAQKYTTLPDSLVPAYTKIDSIRNEFNLAADSLQNHYQKAIADINSRTNKLNQKIDSLRSLNVRTTKYTKKYQRSLDKLSELRQKTEGEFSEKLNSLKARTSDKLSALGLPPEYKEPLQNLTKQIDGLSLKNDVIKIPELKIPGYDLPKLDGVADIPSLKGIDNPSNLGNLPKIETPGGDLGQVTQQVQGYQDDIKNVTQGNLDDVKQLPKTIEDQASKIEGMDELQKQSEVIAEHKAKLDDFKDPNNAKEKAVEVAKKTAVDHFAGKEEQLKAAMEKISKYKQKYSSVSSIKDLPKRPPNPMKGKPFIERLIPGLYFQYQQKNFYLIDVNSYVGYKLTGRFYAGLGWNHRYAWDSKHKTWNQRSRIFGPRGYVDFKLGKGFIAHIEGEAMNSFVPSTILGNPDAGQREWVWSCMTGLKKEYRIYKNLKGTALIQYNLFNRYYKAPYVDRLNSRIGFEYVFKRQKRKRSFKHNLGKMGRMEVSLSQKSLISGHIITG